MSPATGDLAGSYDLTTIASAFAELALECRSLADPLQPAIYSGLGLFYLPAMPQSFLTINLFPAWTAAYGNTLNCTCVPMTTFQVNSYQKRPL